MTSEIIVGVTLAAAIGLILGGINLIRSDSGQALKGKLMIGVAIIAVLNVYLWLTFAVPPSH